MKDIRLHKTDYNSAVQMIKGCSGGLSDITSNKDLSYATSSEVFQAFFFKIHDLNEAIKEYQLLLENDIKAFESAGSMLAEADSTLAKNLKG